MNTHTFSVGPRGWAVWPEWRKAQPGQRVRHVRTGWTGAVVRVNVRHVTIRWDESGAIGRVVAPAYDLIPSAITPRGQREQEARRIAREDGHPIIGPSADWTAFSLADDLVTDKGTLRTTFVWEGFRFEGHVYYVNVK